MSGLRLSSRCIQHYFIVLSLLRYGEAPAIPQRNNFYSLKFSERWDSHFLRHAYMRIQCFTVPSKVFYQFSIYCKICCIWLWHATTFRNTNFCFLWINTKCSLGFSNAFFVEQRGHELACFVDGTKHLMENNKSSNSVIERLHSTFQAQLDRNLCKVRLSYFSTDLFLSFTEERIFFLQFKHL